MARELVILPRFKRDYRTAREHPEIGAETLEYVFDVMTETPSRLVHSTPAEMSPSPPSGMALSASAGPPASHDAATTSAEILKRF